MNHIPRSLRLLQTKRLFSASTLKTSKNSSTITSSAPKDGKTMPHVNEEAVAYDNIIGKKESSTADDDIVPAKDILRQSKEGIDNAPKVVKDEVKYTAHAENNASNSSTARSQLKTPASDSVLDHLVGIIMKDGKKSQAQRRVQDALNLLQRATQSDPLASLKDAIERVSPLMKMIQRKQGSKNIPVPIPLTEKGRRRRAINWILEASQKRTGEKSFSGRLAQEIASVLDGTSSAYQKKEAIHRLALVNRSNAAVKS